MTLRTRPVGLDLSFLMATWYIFNLGLKGYKVSTLTLMTLPLFQDSYLINRNIRLVKMRKWGHSAFLKSFSSKWKHSMLNNAFSYFHSFHIYWEIVSLLRIFVECYKILLKNLNLGRYLDVVLLTHTHTHIQMCKYYSFFVCWRVVKFCFLFIPRCCK